MPIHFGTCSWKYDSWRGIIYPDAGSINYLQIYSQTYRTVEIDQWFWSLFRGNTIALPKVEVVREYGVFLHGYYMPPVNTVYSRHKDRIRDRTVIRLHGSGRQEIEHITGKDWSRIVAPQDRDIAQLSDMLFDVSDRQVETFLYVNNHFEGSAPGTIERIKEKLLEQFQTHR